MSNETRKLPTRAGWWWRMGNHGPYVEEVDGDQNHALFLAIDGSDVVDDGTWLAPIPGPAVCAALAEYGEAVAAYDADELRDANRELTDAEWSASEAIERAVSDATAVLDAAIRAERDGGA